MTRTRDQGYIPGTGRPDQIYEFVEVFLVSLRIELDMDQYGLFAALGTLKHLPEKRLGLNLLRLHLL